MKNILALVGLATLCACFGPPSDPQKGPVVLQCDGDLTTLGMRSSTDRHSYTFRIDGPARKFEVWNGEKFTSWGDGRPKVDANAVVNSSMLLAAGVMATRETRIDRKNGKVTDNIVMSNGIALQFSGDCRPANEPKPSQKKF